MRISHRYKFVFFSNPKTGSESVRKILNEYCDMAAPAFLERTPENPFYSHITPMETKVAFESLGWDFSGYRKFVCVRNPWARLVSLYEMILRLEKRPPQSLPFADWIVTVKPDGLGGGGEDWQRWRKYGTYSLDNFCKDEEGKMLVDKVIRLEHMNQELVPYLAGFGLPNVERLYPYDITTFGYRFGD